MKKTAKTLAEEVLAKVGLYPSEVQHMKPKTDARHRKYLAQKENDHESHLFRERRRYAIPTQL